MLISARFNGPTGSANGGYAAGRFAQALLRADPATVVPGRPVRVTLRRPPPLDSELRVVRTAEDALSVETGGDPVTLIAEAEAVVGSIDGLTGPVDGSAGPAGEPTVPPVDLATAEAASARYPGHDAHPFPDCYVCGPRRPDGLRVFAGPVGDGRTAAPFVVPDDRTVPTVWAALDCPGGWAVLAAGRPYLLGRMTATVAALPAPGQRCVVVGELIETSGRKAEVRTTLYDAAGQPLAAARATWIAIAGPAAG
ncbi:PaaI family thioesterase [Solwaraspora sp. WMMB762]|uniref:PaaI family thioesterase n=1 Tax=Solwaraspora sp. WMMB762 TaxID=3404120 RepID=UPI003B93FB89